MEENLIKRIQPQSTEAEQTVIGSMILDNECIPNMQNLISGRDFYNRQYGALFDAITELYTEGKAVDVLTLQNRMKEKDVSPELASMEYMGELIASVPISANAKYYAEIGTAAMSSPMYSMLASSGETSFSFMRFCRVRMSTALPSE